MKKTLSLAAAFLTFTAFTPFARAALTNRSYTAASQVVAINGVAVPEVVAWSGGEPAATVILIQSAGTAQPRKSPGPTTYTPIVIEATPPFSPALQNCIVEFLGGGSGSGTSLAPLKKTLLLSTLDISAQPAGETLQATGALLTEIHFPSLDAAARTPARVKFVFVPDATTLSASSAPTAGGANVRNTAPSSNFTLALTGLPGTGIAQIDAFIIRRDSIPDLSLTVTSSQVSSWQAWRDAFFPGYNGPAPQTLATLPYKNGTLQLLSPDGRTALFTLQLSKVGLKRLAQQPAESGSLLKFRAELYCESMSAAAASAPTSTSSSNSTPPSTPPSTTTATPSSPVSTTPPPATPTATVPTITGPLTKVPAREADPIKTLSIKNGTPSATTSTTSPNDKGARDPADFPRPPDVVRTSFSSSREPTLTREYVYYTGKTKAADLIAFYEKALESEGWKESSRSEDNSGPDKSFRISSNWTKEKRTAVIVLGDVAPGKVEIYVSLQQQK